MVKRKPDPYRIKRITESIIGLPTLPTIVSKMLELVDNPRTSAASLARLISSDQTLTARILKLANSAYYGFPREISTVNMAIVVLGFNTVKEMGLSLSVFDAFKNQENTSVFDISRFWEHSIGCGIASRMLARNYHSRNASEAFVAGLLHDIGKIILNQYFHREFMQITDMVVEGDTLEYAEEAVIGTNHAQVGCWLAERWNLPEIISQTILYHHHPWNAPKDKVFIATVTLGNYLCHLCSIGNSGRTSISALDTKFWDIFLSEKVPIDEPDMASLQTDFLLEFDKSDTFISLIQDQK
jgi:putative nucleotidyltransferase with HDIG domain